MRVNELEAGVNFYYNGREYMKVRARFNENVVLEVNHDGKVYTVQSDDCAAVNVETGELEFIKDEVELVDGF